MKVLERIVASSRDLVDSLSRLDFQGMEEPCEACAYGKFRRAKVGTVGRLVPVASMGPGEKLHVDVSGKFKSEFYYDGHAYFYFLMVVDDFSRMTFVRLLEKKSHALAEFLDVMAVIELTTKNRLCAIRIDNGEIASSAVFAKYCSTRGITVESIVPHYPHMDGTAERAIGVVKMIARVIHFRAKFPPERWGYSILMANDLRNVRPSTASDNASPSQKYYRMTPEVSHFRVYGCRVLVPLLHNRSKADLSTVMTERVYVGPHSPSIIKCIDERVGLLSYHRFSDCVFYEHKFPYSDQPGVQSDQDEYDGFPEDLHTGAPREGELFQSEQDGYLRDSLEYRSKIGMDAFQSLPAAVLTRPRMLVQGEGSEGSDFHTSPEQAHVDEQNTSIVEPTSESRRITRSITSATDIDKNVKRVRFSEVDNLDVAGNEDDGGIEIVLPDVSDDESTDDVSDVTQFGNLVVNAQYDSCLPIVMSAVKVPEPSVLDVPEVKPVVGLPWDGKLPRSHAEALKTKNAQDWVKAEEKELENLSNHGTFEAVPIEDLPPGTEVLPTMAVYEVKDHPDLPVWQVSRFKVRLVARGDYQVWGVNFFDTYSPVIKIFTLLLLIAICAFNGILLYKCDVVGAYLNGLLDQLVYVKPPDFYPYKNTVWRLIKGLYGLKQAGRLWFMKLSGVLVELGYSQSSFDPCLWYRGTGASTVWIAFYVDDILIVCRPDLIESIVVELKSKVDLTYDGVCRYHLGIEILQSEDGYTFVHQSKYVQRVLSRFNMENCNGCQTPMEVSADYSPKREDEEPLDTSKFDFGSLIGSVMFLMIVSRPDIAVSVSLWARSLHAPTLRHWNGAKRILRYLKHTFDMGIVYFKKGSSEDNNMDVMSLVGLADASEPDASTSKAQSGWLYLFNNQSVVCWRSTKQKLVTVDQTASEHVALYECCLDCPWLLGLCEDLSCEVVSPVVVYSDNASLVSRVRNNKRTDGNKWMHRRFSKIYEMQAVDKVIDVRSIAGVDNPADMLTKPLPKPLFIKHRRRVGLQYLRVLKGESSMHALDNLAE